jgi:hypothetical protein
MTCPRIAASTALGVVVRADSSQSRAAAPGSLVRAEKRGRPQRLSPRCSLITRPGGSSDRRTSTRASPIRYADNAGSCASARAPARTELSGFEPQGARARARTPEPAAAVPTGAFSQSYSIKTEHARSHLVTRATPDVRPGAARRTAPGYRRLAARSTPPTIGVRLELVGRLPRRAKCHMYA